VLRENLLPWASAFRFALRGLKPAEAREASVGRVAGGRAD